MKTFPSSVVYDHFANAFIGAGAVPINMVPGVFVVEMNGDVIKDVTEMDSSETIKLLELPDGQNMLMQAVQMMTEKVAELDPEAYAVVMAGEVKCAVFKGSQVKSQAHLDTLRPDYSSPSKLIIAIHRPEGCKAGIMAIGDDRKLTYEPLNETNAVLIPTPPGCGPEDDDSEDDHRTTINVTIH